VNAIVEGDLVDSGRCEREAGNACSTASPS